MDHLQKVQNPIRRPVAVPFVCHAFLFDPKHLTFEEFQRAPQEHGHPFRPFAKGTSTQQMLANDAAFLQSWLFFGSLVQVFGPIGVNLDRDEFVRTDDEGSRFITTEAMPKYLWFWLAVRHHQPRRETENHVELVDSCLQLANTVTNQLATLQSSSGLSRSQVPSSKTLVPKGNLEQSVAAKVLLSVVILGETLCYARNQIIRYSVGPELQWRYPPFGLALLRDSGWCIAEIHNL